jgi:hypothetical protein
MGNIIPNEKIVVDIKKKLYKVITVRIPYSQLSMIQVLQKEFDYEVKGTIYVDHDHEFKSFEVRTDNSEIYSYGASDWRISFHTHPDKTAQKYGIRYYSPPSVDDIMEIYDHSLQYVPDTTQSGFGELSIIFTNEGLYVLQVNRDSFREFNKENLPVEGLEEILNQTLTSFLVSEVRKGIYNIVDGKSITTQNSAQATAPTAPTATTAPTPTATKVKIHPRVKETSKEKPVIKKKPRTDVDMEDPDITVEQFTSIVKRISSKISELYGFDMTFFSWPELQRDGLTLKVCNYFLNKKVID